MDIDAKLKSLGLAMPAAPAPVGSYLPGVRTGNLILLSGQIPFKDGKLLQTGSVPSQASLKQAQASARQCVLNGLAIVRQMLDGDLSRVRRVVRLGVFVQSDNGFFDQAKVANAASDLMVELFGDAGRHVRASVGVNALPLNSTTEVEMMVEVV